MSMFLFHSSRVVSSIGADEAMPALETRMSMPPNSTAVSAKPATTWPSEVTSIDTGARNPCRTLGKLVAGMAERFLVDIGQHHAGAFAQQPVGRRPSDAAGAAGDERDAAGQRLRLGHALQLGFFELPVLDVEGFLLRQADIVSDTVEAPRMTLMALT
jgi:hypothetical protein